MVELDREEGQELQELKKQTRTRGNNKIYSRHVTQGSVVTMLVTL